MTPDLEGDELWDPEDVEQFRRALVQWLEKDVRPHVLEFEHGDEQPSEMVEQVREFGLFGATIAEAYGGLGLPAAVYAEIVEVISEIWMSLTGVINSHPMMAHLVAGFGTEEQRRSLLARFASGELRGATP